MMTDIEIFMRKHGLTSVKKRDVAADLEEALVEIAQNQADLEDAICELAKILGGD